MIHTINVLRILFLLLEFVVIPLFDTVIPVTDFDIYYIELDADEEWFHILEVFIAERKGRFQFGIEFVITAYFSSNFEKSNPSNWLIFTSSSACLLVCLLVYWL